MSRTTSPARSAFRAAWRLTRMRRQEGTIRRAATRAASSCGAEPWLSAILGTEAVLAAKAALDR